ncbi:uncharacterized protein LOC131220748 isoform X1 [Magnolia sinica]|uniref:uncharacterized protein LOC131220748 isoform X1 n=1 Tax=Magnolia sinica TaxID=86752 RepID=UPI00265AAC99|nr:uncharacterized protein LOC131220748 isoform X1 [Magnolia sinica]
MPCFVPFHGRNLDISFFVFKPIGLFAEELIEALKYVSFCSEDHGCAYSSVFKSLHGNLVIWYGAWMKRSNEKKELLSATLKSALANVSSMAILLDYSFFEPYAGESKDGHPIARFSSGDTISMNSMLPASDDLTDLSYASVTLLKSCFLKMDGVTAGVCFRCYDRPRVACLQVWKSVHSCYSWLLNSNFRKTISPYLDQLYVDLKCDVFRVVYVSSDDLVNIRFFPLQILTNCKEGSDSENESFESL